jgi:hypothetical protein
MATAVNQANRPELLTAEEMAQFVMDGYIEMDEPVPDELNAEVKNDAGNQPRDARWTGLDLNAFWDRSEAVQSVHKLPQFQRILKGLMGNEAIQNHSWLHITPAGHRAAQQWHVDQDRSSVQLIGNDPWDFDILTLYFPHDVPREMGPTLILPGSHLRSVSGRDLGRYKNFVGQKHLSGPGGRIIFSHSLLWHCAQPNRSNESRYMFKIRYNPAQRQQGLFNTTMLDNPDIDQYFRKNIGRHPWLAADNNSVAGRVREWWAYTSKPGESGPQN